MYILLGDTPACLPCAMWLLYNLQRLRDADFVGSQKRKRNPKQKGAHPKPPVLDRQLMIEGHQFRMATDE